MTTRELLKQSSEILKNTSTTPLLDSEVFLCEAIQKPKEFILANPDYELSKNQEKKFWEMVERRKKEEPVAYIIGKKEFFGIDFYVDKNTLIPRPETEWLVEKAIEIISEEPPLPPAGESPLPKGEKTIDIIDVGTGSGCIIGAIANYFLRPTFFSFRHPEFLRSRTKDPCTTTVKMFATDNSANSLNIAKENFKNLKLNNINASQGNLLEPYFDYLNKKEKDPSSSSPKVEDFLRMTKNRDKEKNKISIIIANLPYLNEEEYKNCPNEVKKYEPKEALYGGKDGLKYINKLIRQLAEQIEKSKLKNYILMLEISPIQAEYLRTIGFEIEKDSYNIDRYAIRNSLFV